jgi:hypothetical protein
MAMDEARQTQFTKREILDIVNDPTTILTMGRLVSEGRLAAR